MAEWTTEDGLRWRPVTPFGIEIDHDLALSLTGAEAQRLVTLFQTAGLILARGQRLTMAQQAAVMALFGPVSRRIDGLGYISSEDFYSGARGELTFHADYAFGPHPLDALSLHAVDVVDGASSTRFANAERAYGLLPTDLRAKLSTHPAEMISPSYDALAIRACESREPPAVIRDQRPSVLFNPRSRRPCIGVGEMHAAQLTGMSWEESRDVLRGVYDYLYAPENILEHVWRQGDLVLWDNITIQHARGSLEGVGRRVLQRVTVGEKALWEMYPAEFPETEPLYAW